MTYSSDSAFDDRGALPDTTPLECPDTGEWFQPEVTNASTCSTTYSRLYRLSSLPAPLESD
jgi:hypothetical protein